MFVLEKMKHVPSPANSQQLTTFCYKLVADLSDGKYQPEYLIIPHWHYSDNTFVSSLCHKRILALNYTEVKTGWNEIFFDWKIWRVNFNKYSIYKSSITPFVKDDSSFK